MAITLHHTSFEGVFTLSFDTHVDGRGSFSELYHQSKFHELGIDTVFVQDNFSFSKKGTLRGLHFQKHHQQAKLIYPLSGKIFDVVVDLRKDSKTYGRVESFFLEKGKAIFIPKGFAHGFLAVSDATIFYKCDDLYHPSEETGILWNDQTLSINWQKIFVEYGIDQPILSLKDKNLPPFNCDQK